MAKKVTKEEMEARGIKLDEAMALREECRYGAGSPIEVRLSAAILEGGENTKELTKEVIGLRGDCAELSEKQGAVLERLGAVSKQISSAGKDIRTAARDARNVHGEIVDEAMARLEKEVIPRCEADFAAHVLKSLNYTRHVQEKAEEVIGYAEQYNAKFEKTAGRLERVASGSYMPAPFKAVLFAATALLALSSFTCCSAMTTLSPIMTGEVAIEYSEDYRNSLTEANRELSFARAELDAYREAVRDGLPDEGKAALDKRISKLEAERAEQPAAQEE